MSWICERILWIILFLLVIIVIYVQHPMFWASPKWKRLERIKKSNHYKRGQFKNLSKTPLMTYSKVSPRWNEWLYLLKRAKEWVRPPKLPVIQTDLHSIDKKKNYMVWFWHSSYYIQLDWKSFLIDPTLETWAPVPFVNRSFPWTNIYKPKDIPEVDYLIITHDHYDHLDYFTVKALKKRIKYVVCWLWVWAHFEKWGFKPEQLIELEWWEDYKTEWLHITALPSRHFSWRFLRPNNTLWAWFMLESKSKNIYIAWDWWYDTFYKEIWKNFDIDYAIVENGQYSMGWRYIHTLPEQLHQTISDLWAKYVIPAHNSKYALSTHLWDDPLRILSNEAKKYHFNLLTPMIWEIIDLDAREYHFKKWREEVENNFHLFPKKEW